MILRRKTRKIEAAESQNADCERPKGATGECKR